MTNDYSFFFIQKLRIRMEDTTTPYKQLSNHVTRDVTTPRSQTSCKNQSRDYELHDRFHDNTTLPGNEDAMFPSSLATGSLVAMGRFGCYGNNTKRYFVIATGVVMVTCLLITAVVFLWIIQNQSKFIFFMLLIIHKLWHNTLSEFGGQNFLADKIFGTNSNLSPKMFHPFYVLT